MNARTTAEADAAGGDTVAPAAVRRRGRRGVWRSLRVRLMLGATALAALAVLASQMIGYTVLKSWLTDRVDQQLGEFGVPDFAFQAVESGSLPPPPPSSGSAPGLLPSDFRVYFYGPAGQLLPQRLGEADSPGPALPTSRAELHLTVGAPATVATADGSRDWRVLWQRGPDGMSAVVALPLDTVESTASRLMWLDAAVLAVTVVGLLAVGRWVIRLGLLPLTRMERTAEKIADGDLDLRLPDTDPRTEIGRLSRVLNTMLEHLQRALRARESSEARLRRFVADAGHELRTPLTAIHGYAELALRHEQRPPAEQRETQRLIVQNAEGMRLIIDDLQLLASLDREPSYRSDPVDLLSVAADAVSTAALHHPTHPISLGPLRTPADPTASRELDVVEVVGDEHRLRQVVAALLANAHAHTPPGTRIHVRVGTTRAGAATGGTDRPGRTSATAPVRAGTPVGVVEVADEGPGLEPEHAEKVFERFYRAERSRSRAHGGSGLGLAIAASIAEGHHGRVELDTGPDTGCTFRLVLPASGPRF